MAESMENIQSLIDELEIGIGTKADTIEITGYYEDDELFSHILEHGNRQTIEFGFTPWFMPGWKAEAIMTKYDEGGIEGTIIEDTYQDITDYRLHAKMLRWMYNNSNIFRWTYHNIN